MEPNVDRGMWSVVVLLAAIVIGGVVLLAFPRISGKIANSMDDTVNKAFSGEVPEWVVEKPSTEKQYVDFLNEIEQYKVYVKDKSYFPSYFKESKRIRSDENNIILKEWGVNDASYFEAIKGTALTTENDAFYVFEPTGSKTNYQEEECFYMLVKNVGETNISIKAHALNKFTSVKPGETKFIEVSGKVFDGWTQTNLHAKDKGAHVKLYYYKPTYIRGENLEKVKAIRSTYDF